MASVIEDFFDEFANWDKHKWWGFAEGVGLSVKQKDIVERNVALLLDPEAWAKKVSAFEEELLEIDDKSARDYKRANFTIHFDYADFSSRDAVFAGRHFPCNVSFDKATFGDADVYFDETTFGDGYVSFVSASFGGGYVSFGNVAFGDGDVLFNGATFGDIGVSFHSAMFGDGDVSFDHTTFGDGEIWFDEAVFGDGNVSFDRATFGKTSIYFVDVKVKGNFIARNNTYPLSVSFQRLSVAGTADFSHSTFHTVPDFTDAKLDRSPDVSGLEVLSFKKNWIWPWWKAKADEGAKFRKLKAMALAANDHEKDGEFFAYEMLAKRGYDAGNTGPVALFINWLYFTFSNFGQSYLRPAIGLLLSWFCFFLINALLLGQLFVTDDRMTFAVWHSFRNTLPFINSLFRFSAGPEGHQLWYGRFFNEIEPVSLVDTLILLGIVQNFIGLILLFLLLLGLRNKFRLK